MTSCVAELADTRGREAFGEIITITVGVKPEDERCDGVNAFKVHKGVLCFYSSFFDALLNDSRLDSPIEIVELPEERAETFKHFIAWLYTRQLPVDHESSKGSVQWLYLYRLWLLANRRAVPLLANRCINTIREMVVIRQTIPLTHLSFVYKSTIPNSPLRQFLVQMMAATIDVSVLNATDQTFFPADALWDVLMLVWGKDTRKTMSDTAILALDLCKYHWHEEGVRCPKESTAHIKAKFKKPTSYQ